MINKKWKASTKIEIRATPSVVWEAITDPEIVKQYFFGTRVHSSWKVGDPIKFSGSWEGKTYEDKGTIRDIDPGKYLRFDYWSDMSGTPDIPENYSDIEYLLEGGEEGTLLTVSQSNIRSREAMKDSEENWKLVLGEMKKLLES